MRARPLGNGRWLRPWRARLCPPFCICRAWLSWQYSQPSMNVRSRVTGVRSSLALAKNVRAHPRSIDQPAALCSVHLISSAIIDACIIGWSLFSVSVCSVQCISLLRPTSCRQDSYRVNCLHYPCTTAFYLRRPGPSCRPSLHDLINVKIFRVGWPGIS